MREGIPQNVRQAWAIGDEEALHNISSAGGKAAAQKRAAQKKTEAERIKRLTDEATRQNAMLYSEHDGDVLPPPEIIED